jgi:glycosyltransferase involved in cell wall biosynthesis
MNKKILIVAPYSFGELSDCYYWAKYAAKNGAEVTYLGYSGASRKLDNVTIISVEHFRSKIKLFLSFYGRLINEIRLNNHHNIIFSYWKFCFLIPILFPKKNIVLDIRTSSVNPNSFKRVLFNFEIRFSSLFFKKVSVISQGVRDILKINQKKSVILPLGAENLSSSNKKFTTELKLFYIGVFNQRNISDTIIGFSKFISEISENARYDIVGFGTKEEEDLIEKTIINNNLTGKVVFHGKKTHEEAKHFFNTCNLGVSYIPLESYFDNQPPTKTFEYLLAGQVVLATNTTSNREIITPENGVLVNDNPDSFYQGLVEISKNGDLYSSDKIRKSVSLYHWKNIVRSFFLPLFFYKP